MQGTKEIKERINSIKDTQKITNAMYLISSTKLQKAKRSLDETEPYFYSIQAMMERLLRHLPNIDHEYFNQHTDMPEEEKVSAFLVVTADKGLAGAYNHNVLKLTEEKVNTKPKFKLFVVGEVGRHYFEKKNIPVEEEFKYTAQNPSLHRARMISLTMLDLYRRGQIHELNIIFTTIKSGMDSNAQIKQLLPLQVSIPNLSIPMDVYHEEFFLKPSTEAVVDYVVPNYLNGFIYSALVESFCAEQNSRMMAMQSANDSANKILHELSIKYNRVRQTNITQEITEVTSGAKALRGHRR